MTTQTSETPAFCDAASPIYISKDDVLTDKTADQILLHNLVGKELCGWGKDQKATK